METRTRTIAKTLTWRASAFVMTAIIAWVATGRLAVAASIGLTDTVVKLAAYYIHERMWLKVRFGRRTASDYEI